MAIDPKVLEDLKKQHGDVHDHKIGGFDFAIRNLNEAEFQRVVDAVNSERQKSHAPKMAAEMALVYPPVEVRRAHFARKPGHLIKIGELVFKNAGLEDEVETGEA